MQSFAPDSPLKVFGVPILIEGWKSLPLAQLLGWLMMAWIAGRRKPQRSWPERLKIGALTLPVALGSEWGHNLAHVAAAWTIGKPADEVRIYAGMPRLVYHNVNDPAVTPRQHILRALGGPLFNTLLLPFAWLWRKRTSPGSAAWEMADTAVAVNAFICSAGLLPIPMLDGGPLLKWSLVERGRTPAQADAAVRKVNGVMGAGMAVGAAVALQKRRWGIGALLSMFAASALGVACGWLKE